MGLMVVGIAAAFCMRPDQTFAADAETSAQGVPTIA